VTDTLKAVIIGGLLLVAAALVFGGLYTTHPLGRGQAFVLNRLTGAAWVCRPELHWKCLPAGEAPPKQTADDWIIPDEPKPRASRPANPFDQFDTPAKAKE